jgi:hypothetical protein
MRREAEAVRALSRTQRPSMLRGERSDGDRAGYGWHGTAQKSNAGWWCLGAVIKPPEQQPAGLRIGTIFCDAAI